MLKIAGAEGDPLEIIRAWMRSSPLSGNEAVSRLESVE
jgi:hypothetical protein